MEREEEERRRADPVESEAEPTPCEKMNRESVPNPSPHMEWILAVAVAVRVGGPMTKQCWCNRLSIRILT